MDEDVNEGIDFSEDGLQEEHAESDLDKLTREAEAVLAYTLTFDFLNDAVTELRPSTFVVCEFPRGPSHPPFVD